MILPDEDGVDAIAFFFVAREGEADAVEPRCGERVLAQQHYQRPKWLHAVDALPRTATGKLLRRKLSELIRPAA